MLPADWDDRYTRLKVVSSLANPEAFDLQSYREIPFIHVSELYLTQESIVRGFEMRKSTD